MRFSPLFWSLLALCGFLTGCKGDDQPPLQSFSLRIFCNFKSNAYPFSGNNPTTGNNGNVFRGTVLGVSTESQLGKQAYGGHFVLAALDTGWARRPSLRRVQLDTVFQVNYRKGQKLYFYTVVPEFFSFDAHYEYFGSSISAYCGLFSVPTAPIKGSDLKLSLVNFDGNGLLSDVNDRPIAERVTNPLGQRCVLLESTFEVP